MSKRVSASFVAATAAICLASLCYADGVAFKSPDGKFKAEFPAEPKTTEQKTPAGVMKMYLAMQGTTTFLITQMPLAGPANAKPEDLEKILDSTRDGLVNTTKAKVISDEKIELDKKYPGRELVTEMGEAGVRMRLRFYLVDGMLYQVIVGGIGADSVKTKEANTFFDSFKLAK
jgi:hypothetical protein